MNDRTRRRIEKLGVYRWKPKAPPLEFPDTYEKLVEMIQREHREWSEAEVKAWIRAQPAAQAELPGRGRGAATAAAVGDGDAGGGDDGVADA